MGGCNKSHDARVSIEIKSERPCVRARVGQAGASFFFSVSPSASSPPSPFLAFRAQASANDLLLFPYLSGPQFPNAEEKPPTRPYRPLIEIACLEIASTSVERRKGFGVCVDSACCNVALVAILSWPTLHIRSGKGSLCTICVASGQSKLFPPPLLPER